MVESMRYLIAFGFLATAVGQECGVPNDASAYIVGGDAARRLEFPWQISLQKFENGVWSHTCGGSIIDKNWVLTAAHCVDYRFQGLEPLRVVAGEHDLTKNEGTEIYFAVNRRRGDIAIHPQWDSDIVDYDYALIQLDRPLNFTGAQSRLAPICLPTPADATTFDGMTCVGSGWGVTKRNGQRQTSRTGAPPKSCLQNSSTSTMRCGLAPRRRPGRSGSAHSATHLCRERSRRRSWSLQWRFRWTPAMFH
ncbi:chymotrypsin-like elastase family member 1 isoform X2 [Galendromus occidentalis]|uniref:Chymotrypsin-like elastase family member 1 isoform X2 n=1 Tax=Galendromus occidentalis TaxID=34638 RepID=A0AAJ7PA64_9ACAR|nr:chymotrypsin-like elastase family member 1 isoform X2 [Galendromus occidentalis]